MKKVFLVSLLIAIILSAYVAWNLLGPTVSAKDDQYFYIPTGSTYNYVKQELIDQEIISNPFFFERVAKQVNYDKRIRPGRYKIKDKSSLVDLVRLLKRGDQVPVRLVINKLRTKEDLAGKLGRQFETDSLKVLDFLTSNDSLAAYNVDTNNVMTLIIPNSYLIWWNTPVNNIFKRLASQKANFWQGSRSEKARKIGLTNDEVHTLASIVEEETNKVSDKANIASTYLNRLKKGMKLEADPTVKFAMKNFGLKRILRGHLQYPSPFNTYRNTGLPPGPIGTASVSSIDAILNAPETDYLFFVAKPGLTGYSIFSNNYAQHLLYAKEYQRFLDSFLMSRVPAANLPSP